jgi:hypothetical protein
MVTVNVHQALVWMLRYGALCSRTVVKAAAVVNDKLMEG